MKKKLLLFTLSAGLGAITLMSYDNGPAQGGAGNRTGSKGSVADCSSGGCHSGGVTAPAISIRVDSTGGVPVTRYAVGKIYTVTITGTHPTLTKYGFQMSGVSGTGSSQIQAGSFSGFPTGVSKRSISGLEMIEHNAVISGALSKSFLWAAPSTNVGNVKLYLTVNAVNGDDLISGDISANTSISLSFYAPPTSSVATVANTLSVSAFPNPVVNMLNIQMGNATSNCNVQVYDMMGRNVANTTIDASNITGTASISTASWAAGMYQVVVSNETGRQAIQVVKQ